ncbi:hypothetical protein BDBG_18026, partial [Blastomyces gilchristii SLH14081]
SVKTVLNMIVIVLKKASETNNILNHSTTNSLDFSNKNPPIDPSKSPRSYEHSDPIADRIPCVVVELFSQT